MAHDGPRRRDPAWLSDEEYAAWRAATKAAWRKVATEVFRLPRLCAIPACRRARACTDEDASCIRRHRDAYSHLLPAFRAAMKRRAQSQAEAARRRPRRSRSPGGRR